MLVQSRGKTKSVLYLSVYDPHIPLAGAGVRGGQFVSHLAQYFNLDLVYIDGSGHPSPPDLPREFSSELDGVRQETRIRFSEFGYFIFSHAMYRAAERLLREHKYDMILCDYGLSAVYGLLLAKEFNIPWIYCSHNVEHRQYLGKARSDWRRYLLVPYVYWVERQAVRKSRVLVAISNSDAEFFSRWTDRADIVVVPQGFDEAIFNPFYEPVRNDPKIVLYCGNYNIQTNIDAVGVVMEHVLGRVLAAYPDVKFRFIGANPPQDVRHPNVEFTGFVVDYARYLKQADVVISPLGQGWGFPTKIVEALACGKPTIATPAGARSVERDYESLHICELDQFPEKICKVLVRGESVIMGDYEKLKSRYSWHINLQSLVDRIEGEI